MAIDAKPQAITGRVTDRRWSWGVIHGVEGPSAAVWRVVDGGRMVSHGGGGVISGSSPLTALVAVK